ncbi:hypothetical protein HNQ99_002501 [Rhizorhapis suberifaciens]|uniref:Uncharacterized protein n=1 Tax=Rhizorhapis suberifaciens TaxID=13656 RepID=A0A840HX88_9SPHN|nr:hypothetical protein [Rhizorhapis suberifaciens]
MPIQARHRRIRWLASVGAGPALSYFILPEGMSEPIAPS